MKKQQSSREPGLQSSARERILHAAMETFMELGYTEASTLKIATRAQVSKRELYALFGNKQAMLAACIADRAGRMQLPAQLPPPRNPAELMAMLAALGATALREVSHPVVMAVFRLAIIEGQRAPEVAATLEDARQLIRTAVRDIVVQAQSSGLIAAGSPAELSCRFLALLWDDLMVSILLRVRDAPGPAEIGRRAGKAAGDFMQLYCEPKSRARPAAKAASPGRSRGPRYP